MLQIGFTEMVVFAGIAFLLFGPDQITVMGKRALQTVWDLRAHVDEMKDAVGRQPWDPPRTYRADDGSPDIRIVALAALFGAGLVVLLAAAFWALQGL